jgi:hypothetical protein
MAGDGAADQAAGAGIAEVARAQVVAVMLVDAEEAGVAAVAVALEVLVAVAADGDLAAGLDERLVVGIVVVPADLPGALLPEGDAGGAGGIHRRQRPAA